MKSFLQTAALILMVTSDARSQQQQQGNAMRPRSSPVTSPTRDQQGNGMRPTPSIVAAPSSSPSTPSLRNGYRLFIDQQQGNAMRPRSSPVSAPTSSLFDNDQQGITRLATQDGLGKKPTNGA
eukprot:scaffold1641_cov64-Cyclotella_meneghiniana.AAC.5